MAKTMPFESKGKQPISLLLTRKPESPVQVQSRIVNSSSNEWKKRKLPIKIEITSSGEINSIFSIPKPSLSTKPKPSLSPKPKPFLSIKPKFNVKLNPMLIKIPSLKVSWTSANRLSENKKVKSSETKTIQSKGSSNC
ncbi:hypothetical protein AMTR_s00119p00079160 [Amborella trichopoda]|uniref:Uncharacterized protein n=1 Tax=Amborella trichopoda TaxID=13333 RepID=W1NNC6_AMBTC|nr:hypothetical protein AMTR_s00119p00079160 [Amborella trichopoda]